MSPIVLSDRLLANQPLKFKMNSFMKEDKKIIDYALLNYREGIFRFSSELNQIYKKEVQDYIEKNYRNYEFCDMGTINCFELGFSRLNLEAKLK